MSGASGASEASLVLLTGDEIGREISELVHAHSAIIEALLHARQESVEMSRVENERVIAAMVHEMEGIEEQLDAPNLTDGIPALKEHLRSDGT